MPAHDSLFLQRNVVTTARLNYTLRTAPCCGITELVLYDNLLRSTVCATLNVEITDMGWLQASLPVRWGGLGVRSAVLLAPSAYLASAAGTLDRVISSCLPTYTPSLTHLLRPRCNLGRQPRAHPSFHLLESLQAAASLGRAMLPQDLCRLARRCHRQL